MKRNLTCATLTLALGITTTALATVTGQWDFNSSNLVATVGTDLAYFGDTDTVTTFTNATIGGSNAIVMAFPATTPTQGYVMTHGIAPNGGGSYVNQYTLIMDVMFPTESDAKYRSLFQTSQNNGNDTDLCINPNNGIGISGSYQGTIAPNTWYRIACVFDMTLSSGQLKKYIDGTLVGSQNLAAVDGRWALDPTALLFADEDNETAAGFVNSIQIHDVPLSASDIFALAGPSAAGIPTTIPVLTDVTVTVTPASRENVAGMTGTHFSATAVGSGALTYQWYRDGKAVAGQTNTTLRFTNLQLTDAGNYTVVVGNGLKTVTSSPPVVLTVNNPGPALVTGQWDFANSNLNATLGHPMEYFNTAVQADVQFGTTTGFGISDIAGQPANVVQLNPSTIGSAGWAALVVPHGISPNGGGTNVNQYTLIMDVLYPNWTSGFYRGLLQTDISNTNDADAFLDRNNGLGISVIYNGELTLDQWHRIVLTFDLTKREMGKYIDGTNVLTTAVGSAPLGPNDVQYLSAGTNVVTDGGVDMRWSLGPKVLILADGDDGEVQPVFVSSVQMRNGRMTDAAIALLGAPTAAKIPGAIKASRAGSSIVIDWTGNVLERTSNLGGSWETVSGASHPYTVAVPTGTQFFRVRQ